MSRNQGSQSGDNQDNSRGGSVGQQVAGGNQGLQEKGLKTGSAGLYERHATADNQVHKTDVKQTRHGGNNVGTSPNSHTRGSGSDWHAKTERQNHKNQK